MYGISNTVHRHYKRDSYLNFHHTMGAVMLTTLLLLIGFIPKPETAPQVDPVYGKIFIQMSKKDLLYAFGEPSSIIQSDDHQQLLFRGPMCENKDFSCSVIIREDRVTKFSMFKPKYQ